jgi:non-specific serine/threonine protein kinase
VRALTAQGRLLTAQGINGATVQLMRPCVDLARQCAETVLLADAVMVLGLGLVTSGELAEALALFDEAVQLAALAGKSQVIASAKLYQAIGAKFAGDLGTAEALLAACRQLCASDGDKLILGYALVNSGLVALMREGPGEAGAFAREGLPIYQALRNRVGLCMALECLASSAAAARDFRRAARLLGILQRQSSMLGGSPLLVEPFLSAHRDCEAASRRALGETTFAAEYRRGQELPAGDAVTYALADDHATADEVAADHPSVSQIDRSALTGRQRQVAELVAQGLSNKEIARKLLIGVRTADSHVQNILCRLGFTSRIQIASWHARRRRPAE